MYLKKLISGKTFPDPHQNVMDPQHYLPPLGPLRYQFHKNGVKRRHLLVPGAKNDGGAEWSDGRVEGVGVHVRAHPLGQVRQGDGRTVVTPVIMIGVHEIKDIV
jgi:hypothetical protein